jgi:hypothetical protein
VVSARACAYPVIERHSGFLTAVGVWLMTVVI